MPTKPLTSTQLLRYRVARLEARPWVAFWTALSLGVGVPLTVFPPLALIAVWIDYFGTDRFGEAAIVSVLVMVPGVVLTLWAQDKASYWSNRLRKL